MSNARPALSRLVLALFRANRALLGDGDRFAAAHRLTSAKWKTLGALAAAGAPATGPEIGRRMGLSRQGMQKQLDALVEGGMVARAANPADARAPLYSLSAKGRRAYAKLSEAWKARSDLLSAQLDEQKLSDAADTLHRLVKALEASAGRS